jgi:hypothetical protein
LTCSGNGSCVGTVTLSAATGSANCTGQKSCQGAVACYAATCQVSCTGAQSCPGGVCCPGNCTRQPPTLACRH